MARHDSKRPFALSACGRFIISINLDADDALSDRKSFDQAVVEAIALPASDKSKEGSLRRKSRKSLPSFPTIG